VAAWWLLPENLDVRVTEQIGMKEVLLVPKAMLRP
jgi:hypothetical protein